MFMEACSMTKYEEIIDVVERNFVECKVSLYDRSVPIDISDSDWIVTTDLDNVRVVVHRIDHIVKFVIDEDSLNYDDIIEGDGLLFWWEGYCPTSIYSFVTGIVTGRTDARFSIHPE